MATARVQPRRVPPPPDIVLIVSPYRVDYYHRDEIGPQVRESHPPAIDLSSRDLERIYKDESG